MKSLSKMSNQHITTGLLALTAAIALVSFNAKADEAPPQFVKSWGAEGLANYGDFTASKTTGDLYVLDKLKRQVLHFDQQGTSLGQFSAANGKVFASDAWLKVNEKNHVLVGKLKSYQEFTQNGKFIRVGKLTCEGEKASDGSTYVLDYQQFDKYPGYAYIKHYDTECKLIKKWSPYTLPSGYFIRGQMTIDKNDNLYVTRPRTHEVFSFNKDGELLTTWSTDTIGSSSYLTGIRSTTNNNIFVVKQNTFKDYDSQMMLFDNAGTLLSEFDIANTNPLTYFMASKILTINDDQVYYRDYVNNNVQLFDKVGTTVFEVNGNVKKDELFVNSIGAPSVPYTVRKDIDGGFYVWVNGKLKKFSANGFYVKTITFSQDVGSSFAVSPVDGSIYIESGDSSSVKILHCDANGGLLATIGTGLYSNAKGEFKNIASFNVDKTGNLLVTDYDTKRVQVFNRNNKFVGLWLGISAGENLSVDSLGNIYLSKGDKLYKYDANGVLLNTQQLPANASVTAITIDLQNNLFITYNVEQKYKVRKLSADGSLLSEWGSLGNQAGQFLSIDGIAAGDNGDVLVSDAGNNRVQLFSYQ